MLIYVNHLFKIVSIIKDNKNTRLHIIDMLIFSEKLQFRIIINIIIIIIIRFFLSFSRSHSHAFCDSNICFWRAQAKIFEN